MWQETVPWRSCGSTLDPSRDAKALVGARRVEHPGWVLRRALAVLLVLSACGGDDDGDDGGSSIDAGGGGLADAAAVDAATPGPDGGVPPDAAAEPDAGSLPDGGARAVAAPSGMVIDAIQIDGDFTQVRQGSEVDVVVTGAGLAGVTVVVLGEDFYVYPETLVVSDGQVAFRMWVYDRAAPGPADLTLLGDDGSATAALPVTPWVVEAGADLGGRGTYESPMSLCDDQLIDAGSGARVEISAGEHVCLGVTIGPVSEIVGSGIAQTIVRVAGLGVDAVPGTTVILRDLRVVGEGPEVDAISLGSGAVVLRDVVVEGLGLLVRGTGGQLTMERVTIDGGGDVDCVAVDQFAGLSMTDVAVSACRNGIAIPGGNLELASVTITGCEVGVFLGSPPVAPPPIDILGASLSEVELIDNQVGLRQLFGITSATDVAIHGASMGPLLSDVGVEIGYGELHAIRLTVDGVRLGVAAHTIVSDLDRAIWLTIDASLIEGGEVGLDVRGDVDGAGVSMTGSVVRDQSEAAVRLDAYNRDSSFILTENALSVTGGYALDDVREKAFAAEPIDARGTTLNGNAYDGQLIQGPVTLGADLRIASDDGFVQF
jgi:hypothetical protein